MEPRLDEAVRVTVETVLEWLAREESPDVVRQHLGLEVRDGARLRRRHVRRVADREDVLLRRRLQCSRIGRNEAEVVPEPG